MRAVEEAGGACRPCSPASATRSSCRTSRTRATSSPGPRTRVPPQPQHQAHRRAGRPHRQHRRAAGGRGLRRAAPSRAVRARPGLDGAAPRGLPAGGDVPRQPRALGAVLGDAAPSAAPVRLARRRHRLVAGGARRGRARLPRRLPRDPAGRRPGAVPAGDARQRAPARCACCSPAPSRGARAWACCCAPCGYLEDRAAELDARRLRRRRPGAPLRASRAARLRRARHLPRARRRGGGRRPLSGAPTSSARRRSARRLPALALLEAMASGAAVVASRLPGYDEVVQRRGRRAAGAAATAARRWPPPCAGCWTTPELRARARREARCAGARRYDWERVAGEIESVYEEVAGRRRQPLPRRRRQQRELFADFHIHSHHSKDCVMPVADILERAREVGLDVIAITDHDSAAGGSRGARAGRSLRRAGHRRRGGQDAARARSSASSSSARSPAA